MKKISMILTILCFGSMVSFCQIRQQDKKNKDAFDKYVGICNEIAFYISSDENFLLGGVHYTKHNPYYVDIPFSMYDFNFQYLNRIYSWKIHITQEWFEYKLLKIKALIWTREKTPKPVFDEKILEVFILSLRDKKLILKEDSLVYCNY